jgi:cardiolipin synthase C
VSVRNIKRAVIGLCLFSCLGAFLIVRTEARPSLDPRAPTVALSGTSTSTTRLGRRVSPLAAAHPGTSGICWLRDARDAFAARMRLAQVAERTLDVQYYIWRDDVTGSMLFEALHAAADRGVRVRLLLDDNNTSGLDDALAALDAHPNIEVRLFNPLGIRKSRWLNYLVDFARLNRRMHNKSFTADNQATIIGGRNVGDEYFGATDGVLFVDLDLLAVGPVVPEVSDSFDAYWNSNSAYPAGRLLPRATTARLAEVASAARVSERRPEAMIYTSALRRSQFVQDLVAGNLALEWAPTTMISDDPGKGLGLATPETLMPRKLRQALGEPAARLDLVSAYFVPTASGVEWLTGLAKRGVKVRALTNSFEATDVPLVHAGYAKRRRALLKAGVRLYESRLARLDGERTQAHGSKGSSGSSLHAKTFAVDDARVFVGSFNFDPRSAKLNTEMGFVIESPSMARRIDEAFGTRVPMDAYEVRLSETGRLFWMELRNGVAVRHDEEPGTTAWQRAWVRFLSLLPIESLL